jgi:hypothetical protein
MDYNKIQGFCGMKQVIDLPPLAGKIKAFNWAVRESDGHNRSESFGVLKNLPWQCLGMTGSKDSLRQRAGLDAWSIEATIRHLL